MSRPKNWWYGYVKKAARLYPKFADNKSPEYKSFCEAIEKAEANIQEGRNGDEKMKAVRAVIYDDMSPTEYARANFYSRDTVDNWVAEFVNKVGYYKGFGPL